MSEFDPQWEVTVQDVKQRLDARAPLVLIDVRETHEHQTCRISAAKLIPLGEMPDRLEELRSLAETGPLVCHCHHGGRSLRAAAFLRSAGIEDVKSMFGGIDEWSAAIDPSVPRY